MTSYVINCKAVKSQDFSNLHFVGKLGQTIKYLKNHNFRTTQVINIKLVSLKSDKKDLCKYIKSDYLLIHTHFHTGANSII